MKGKNLKRIVAILLCVLLVGATIVVALSVFRPF